MLSLDTTNHFGKNGLISLLFVITALPCMVESVEKRNNDGILSFSIHPTSQLLIPRSERLNNATKRYLSDYNSKSNLIYGTLQEDLFEEVEKKDEIKRFLDDFDRTRHLSRYSKSNQQGGDNQVVPLLQGFGTHYVTVWVGTPPQRKSVIVDTGSRRTAFPCRGCKDCGESHHTDKYFNQSASSTFSARTCSSCSHGGGKCDAKLDRCVLSQGYSEGSTWKAYEAEDQFFVGSNDVNGGLDPIAKSYAINFMFGCQISETGLFVTQLADGIMGLSSDDKTFAGALFHSKKIPHYMFSLCFATKYGQTKEGIRAGVLTLGGADTRLHSSPMVYAENISRKGWYTVNIRQIFLRPGNNTLLEPNKSDVRVDAASNILNGGRGVIVDSGTTDTYMSKELKGAFKNAWSQFTDVNLSTDKFKITEQDFQTLPTIVIQLKSYSENDITVAMPPSHYAEYSKADNKYAIRLYFTERSGGVLGANFMTGHDVLFDLENGRVGFAESNCDYDENISSPLPKDHDTQDILDSESTSSPSKQDMVEHLDIESSPAPDKFHNFDAESDLSLENSHDGQNDSESDIHDEQNDSDILPDENHITEEAEESTASPENIQDGLPNKNSTMFSSIKADDFDTNSSSHEYNILTIILVIFTAFPMFLFLVALGIHFLTRTTPSQTKKGEYSPVGAVDDVVDADTFNQHVNSMVDGENLDGIELT